MTFSKSELIYCLLTLSFVEEEAFIIRNSEEQDDLLFPQDIWQFQDDFFCFLFNFLPDDLTIIVNIG